MTKAMTLWHTQDVHIVFYDWQIHYSEVVYNPWLLQALFTISE